MITHTKIIRATISYVVVAVVLGLFFFLFPASETSVANDSDSEGMTSLMNAVYDGNEPQVKALLSKGARVNDRDRTGKTVLMWASSRGSMYIKPDPVQQRQQEEKADKIHAEIVALLLKKGAKISDQDKKGQTALMWAVSNDCFQVAKVLLEAGADANTRDKAGYTALILGALKADPKLLALLIDKGADVNAKTSKGDSALSEAMNLGLKPQEDLLRKRAAATYQPLQGKNSSNTSKSELNYMIFRDEVRESPLKAQVDLDVIVKESTSEAKLRDLLKKLYGYAQSKRGFKYYSAPTSIYISIFQSESHAKSGQAQQLIRLVKNKDEVEPRVLVNEFQIAGSKIQSGMRFGLSERQRIDVWQDLDRAEDKIADETERRFGYESSGRREDFIINRRSYYEDRVARKYHLSKDEL